MSSDITRTEREAILRRAIMAAIPDFYSWSDEEKKKYKVRQDWKSNFTFYKVIFKELFGFKAETQEELDEYYDELSVDDILIINQTIDAEGKEILLEELKAKLWQYLAARFEDISDSNNKKSFGEVYLLDCSGVDGDPHISFIFSDISVLKEIHFENFEKDVEKRAGDIQEVYAVIEEEKKLVKRFLNNSYVEIKQNCNLKILKLKKKRKIIFTEKAMKDFEDI